jgi:hypothetical protein
MDKFDFLKNRTRQLPGWTTKIEEVSNGVYNVLLKDKSDRKAETTDSDFEQTILKAQEFAFSIEKQLSVSWNRFLFDLCVLILDGLPIIKNYQDAHLGSWIVELHGKRILYDGRDHCLISQLKKGNEWFDTCISTKEELTFEGCWHMVYYIAS